MDCVQSSQESRQAQDDTTMATGGDDEQTAAVKEYKLDADQELRFEVYLKPMFCLALFSAVRMRLLVNAIFTATGNLGGDG